MKIVHGSTIFRHDKSHKVFYNASAYGKETDDELHALLQYLCARQTKLETARVLSTMHLSRADIAKATGLSEDEIKKL